MPAVKLSLTHARRLALHCQLISGDNNLPKGKEGIAQTIDKLGYIQIDTIAVIERAHHHTLWSRRPDYNRDMLHELQAADRRIFEYWGHAASYLPMSDYRYYMPRMKHFRESPGKWEKHLLEKHGSLMNFVLERIRNEGPLGSKDFEKPPNSKKGTWWDWRPAKIALEMLFWRGELMISERRNFQKIYDLPERVLPGDIDTGYPSDNELGRFLVNRALSAHGIATPKEIVDHIHSANKKAIFATLHELVEAGEVLQVSVDRIGDTTYYALPDILNKSRIPKKSKATIRFLSPFDNLIIQRSRTQKLFGFDYALECYTPPAKRKHGYFVLPILYRDNFIGRLDPKADRKSKTLVIRNLFFEDGYSPDDRCIEEMGRGLVRLMEFNNCAKIKIERLTPLKIKHELIKQIKILT